MMKHIFQAGKEDHPTLLLLHGTGGNEYDLLPLIEQIDPEASLLSVRGNILEKGMPRFFRRHSEGVFDEEDLIRRTRELNEFLNSAAKQYHFNRSRVVAIGYSNGANIAASLLFHYKDALAGAILHHPMVPRRNIALPDLRGKHILIAAGRNDPLCPPEESAELQEHFEAAGAKVVLHWENKGHQLTATEVKAAGKWYQAILWNE